MANVKAAEDLLKIAEKAKINGWTFPADLVVRLARILINVEETRDCLQAEAKALHVDADLKGCNNPLLLLTSRVIEALKSKKLLSNNASDEAKEALCKLESENNASFREDLLDAK